MHVNAILVLCCIVACALVSTTNARSFCSVMNVMLPPKSGIGPYVTSKYGEKRTKGTHRGIDFNYNVPGQKGINMDHPTVYSPVSGQVTKIGKKYNTVTIKTDDGYIHQVLHLDSITVTLNMKINAGDVIGTMGGKGPNGANQYAQHVHYQIKDQKKKIVDPKQYYKKL